MNGACSLSDNGLVGIVQKFCDEPGRLSAERHDAREAHCLGGVVFCSGELFGCGATRKSSDGGVPKHGLLPVAFGECEKSLRCFRHAEPAQSDSGKVSHAGSRVGEKRNEGPGLVWGQSSLGKDTRSLRTDLRFCISQQWEEICGFCGPGAQ